MSTTRYRIIQELANLSSYATTSSSNVQANAKATISDNISLTLESGAELALEDNNLLVGKSNRANSVIKIELVGDSPVFTETPTITIDGPGFQRANAIPIISNGSLVRSEVDFVGGIYADELDLITEMGDIISTEVARLDVATEMEIPIALETSNSNIIVDRRIRQRRLPFLTEATYNLEGLLTEMGFEIVSEAPLFEEGPYILLPVEVEGDGTGAKAEGLADLQGSLLGVNIIDGGKDYTRASYKFKDPEVEIPPATAVPRMSGNRISFIEITNPGFGYFVAPHVTILGDATGMSIRLPVSRMSIGHLFLDDVFDFPTLCVYELTDVNTTDEHRILTLNIRGYTRATYSEIDDLIEDISIIINQFSATTTIEQVADCKVTRIGSFEDLFWESSFSVFDIELEVLYSDPE